MLMKLPNTTEDLLKDLDDGIKKLPQRDRNMFVLDLVKFCIDWQFAYLAMKDAEKDG